MDQNNIRSLSVETIIGTYQENADQTEAESLVDILTDLRHWAHQHQTSFERANSTSFIHFIDEIGDVGKR